MAKVGTVFPFSEAQTFEYCCSGDRAPVVTADQPLEELPSFGPGRKMGQQGTLAFGFNFGWGE